MPADAADEVRARLRATDPARALAQDPLAAPLLEQAGDPRAGAVAHIRARDPRSRLDAAAAQLHGAKSDALPAMKGAPEADEPAAPKRRMAF